MASFFLIYFKSVNEASERLLDQVAASLDDGYSWFTSGRRLGIATESAGTRGPDPVDGDSSFPGSYFVDDASGCCVVSDARLDYRQELAGKPGIHPELAQSCSDTRLILSAYLNWKEGCLSHLYGDFSFVIWDPRRDEIFCARDHFGCRALYYTDQQGFLAVASHISAFNRIPGFRYQIREQYILDAICAVERTDGESAYEGISRLMPAHFLRYTNGHFSSQCRYWDLRPKENGGGLTLTEASDELRRRMIEAVRQRVRTTGQIGVELSGGLDSSGIASVLAGVLCPGVRINAFTHAMSAQDTDQQTSVKREMEFSSAVLDKYGSIRPFRVTEEHAEGGFAALTKALSGLYKPVNLHYAANSDLLFEAAGHRGTSIILSGLGGDEGISYSGNGYLNELLGNGQYAKIRELLRNHIPLGGRRFCFQLIRLFSDYYAPWLTDLFRKDWKKARFRSFALQKRLARKYRMKRRFFSTLSLPAKADVRAVQYYRLTYPNIPERMEETSLLGRKHGIEYRYPFLDVKLVEFFYALPSNYKYGDGTGRYLFRMAMEGILPEKVRTRTDKGGNTIPNVFTRVLKDEGIFRAVIEEARTENQYHYVDYDKLGDMLDRFKEPWRLKQRDYGLREFQSAMGVLILQQWQREGKIDIGMKC